MPRSNLRRSVTDLPGFKRSRGLDRICQAHRPSIHRQPGPTATSTSTRPRTSSISVSSPLDLTACARLGEGDRTKETQTLGSFGPIVCCIAVENSPFHGFTNARHQYGDLKRCGDFDCFVS